MPDMMPFLAAWAIGTTATVDDEPMVASEARAALGGGLTSQEQIAAETERNEADADCLGDEERLP